MNEESFLLERFRSFYSKQKISQPPAIEKREFGVGAFGKKISQRHLSFSSHAEFDSFLRQQTPFFVSYSAAYYHDPAARPMESKQWQGADLVFEFDADDLKTDCKVEHDSWVCPQCNASGKGNPESCTQCGASVKVTEWVCSECLDAIKKQSFRLFELLETDLGFSQDLSLNFSGSKGFHVHVRSPEAKSLSPESRIEILDFLTGHGLDWHRLGFAEKNKYLYGIPLNHAKGWQKRILLSLLDLLEKGDSSVLAVAGNVSVRTAEKILAKKESVVASIQKGFFPTVNSKSNAFWGSALDFVSDSLKLDLDRQTSLDKFKIVRVPETLHGSTGLKASVVPLADFKEFDALAESVVFGDSPIPITIDSTPKFSLKGERFGPFKQETTELPEFAAVFLLARGSAHLSEPKNQ